MTVTGLPHAFHVTLIKQSLKTYKGRPVMKRYTTEHQNSQCAQRIAYSVFVMILKNTAFCRIQSLPYKEGTELCCHVQ